MSLLSIWHFTWSNEDCQGEASAVFPSSMTAKEIRAFIKAGGEVQTVEGECLGLPMEFEMYLKEGR